MIKLLFFILAICFPLSATSPASNLLAAEISGPEDFIPQAFDVLHYDVQASFDFDENHNEIYGRCDIKFLWMQNPGDEMFYFHLRDLSVDSVFYDGVRHSATEEGTPDQATYHYYVLPVDNAEAGDTVLLSVYYHGNMTKEGWGGVHHSEKDLYALGVGFHNNYVSTTEHWMPCYDHPSDKATFSGRFIADEKYTVASVGLLVNEAEYEEGKKIYEWQHDIPCATYLYTFAVGEYEKIEYAKDELPVNIYVESLLKAQAEFVFKKVPDMVNCFEKRFGPYPFEKVGFVVTAVGSMEHQTMISFSDYVLTKAYQSSDSTNTTVAHELSHQWFGDAVTCRDFRDAWLNEGFATFCEALWAEEHSGWDAYIATMESCKNSYLYGNSLNDGILSLYNFDREPPSSNYPMTIYNKGAAVLGMLRYKLGDSLFFGGLRHYLEKHKYGTATSAELQADLEEYTGADLETFFLQWVYGKGWPELRIYVDRIGLDSCEHVTLTIKQEQPKMFGAYLDFPLEITFHTLEGDTIYKIINIDKTEMSVSYEGLPQLTKVLFNRGPSVRTLLKLEVTTHISEIEAAKSGELIVYPNPSNGLLNLRYESGSSEDIISIINVNGQSVIEKVFNGTAGTKELMLETSGLLPGNYILVIDTGRKKLKRKLEIAR